MSPKQGCVLKMEAMWLAFVVALHLSCVAAQEVSPECVTAVQRCMQSQGPGNRTSPDQTHDQGCQWLVLRLGCLSGLGDLCDVDETQVTFHQLIPVLRDTCLSLAPLSRNVSDCQALAHCFAQTENARLFNLTDPNLDTQRQQQIVARHVTSTRFWCRFSSENIGCVLSNADTCSFSPDVTRPAQNNLDSVKATCKTSGGSSHPGTGMAALAVCIAVWLLQWTGYSF